PVHARCAEDQAAGAESEGDGPRGRARHHRCRRREPQALVAQSRQRRGDRRAAGKPGIAGALPARRPDQGRRRQARGDAQVTAAKKYNMDQLMTVVLAPVVSEKGTMVADKNRQYVFRVADAATKPEIKAAVELMFKTKVESVT